MLLMYIEKLIISYELQTSFINLNRVATVLEIRQRFVYNGLKPVSHLRSYCDGSFLQQ